MIDTTIESQATHKITFSKDDTYSISIHKKHGAVKTCAQHMR